MIRQAVFYKKKIIFLEIENFFYHMSLSIFRSKYWCAFCYSRKRKTIFVELFCIMPIKTKHYFLVKTIKSRQRMDGFSSILKKNNGQPRIPEFFVSSYKNLSFLELWFSIFQPYFSSLRRKKNFLESLDASYVISFLAYYIRNLSKDSSRFLITKRVQKIKP